MKDLLPFLICHEMYGKEKDIKSDFNIEKKIIYLSLTHKHRGKSKHNHQTTCIDLYLGIQQQICLHKSFPYT